MVAMTSMQRHDIVSYLISSNDEAYTTVTDIAEVSGTSEAFVNRMLIGSQYSEVVYAIRCGEFVKYGSSTDVLSRFRSIATSTPYDVELIGIWEVDHSLSKFEATIHQTLREDHHKREWFVYRDWHSAKIEKMAKDHNAKFTDISARQLRGNTLKVIFLWKLKKMQSALADLMELCPDQESYNEVQSLIESSITKVNNWVEQ